ncbi:MAG: PilN domain-containing protein [Nitrospirae bacterium]|nr:PilN domain-containing protein [Nitrospirota bacterium]MBI3594322.1 PilN domain-containing protein [Nitrospirota bacterium]
MKFTTNFSEFPNRSKQVSKWVLAVLALVTVGFLYYSYRLSEWNRFETNHLQASIDRLQLLIEKEKSGEKGTSDAKKLDQKVALVNEIIIKKSFSWTGFLNSLEKATPKDISIKKIEPHFNDFSVNLSGEALTLKELTNLILSLERKPQFSNVFLLDQKQTINNRTDFLIHLNYKEKDKI